MEQNKLLFNINFFTLFDLLKEYERKLFQLFICKTFLLSARQSVTKMYIKTT